MAKVILHVGTHKTGTTTLQDAFHANRGLLAQHGVIYPALGKHTGHHGLLTDWIALPQAYALPQGGLAALRALADTHRKSDATLFLSSEEFSRAGGAGGHVDMPTLRAVFDGYDDIRVVCCLRPQWQFLQSVYLEVARDRRPPTPPQIVARALETGLVDGLWCDYGALYSHLRSGFEAQQIRFLDFTALRAHAGGFMGGLMAALDLGVAAADLAPVGAGRSNVSPRPLPVWAALALLPEGVAAQGLDGMVLTEAVGTALDLEYGAGRAGSVFTRAEHARLAEHFDRSNAQLAARVALEQPGFCLSAAPIPADTIFREDLGTPFWVRAARRIFMAYSGGQDEMQAGTG